MTGTELIASYSTLVGNVIPGSGIRSPWPLSERIEACADAGFSGLGIGLEDLRGTDLTRLRRTLDEHGIRRVQLEVLQNWWLGDSVDVDLLFAAASELGAYQITAHADISETPVAVDDMRAAWSYYADRAAYAGAQLVLEPLPYSNLKTIEAGAAFVQSVGHPNGGLLVDIWHMQRGGSTLASLGVLIDPRFLFAVELCDGRDPIPAGISFYADSVSNRLLPGEGTWDVTGFIRTMKSLGFQGPWGIELCSTQWRTLSLAEAVGRAAIATQGAMLRR
jgi:sugar phosphate isomerase/epimerase